MTSLAYPDVETSIAADDFAIEDPTADVFASVRATLDGINLASVWAIRRDTPTEMRVTTYRIKNGRVLRTAADVRWSVDPATTPREFAKRFTDEPLSVKVKAARDAHDAFARGDPVTVADCRSSLRERVRTATKERLARAVLALLDRLDTTNTN